MHQSQSNLEATEIQVPTVANISSQIAMMKSDHLLEAVNNDISKTDQRDSLLKILIRQDSAVELLLPEVRYLGKMIQSVESKRSDALARLDRIHLLEMDIRHRESILEMEKELHKNKIVYLTDTLNRNKSDLMALIEEKVSAIVQLKIDLKSKSEELQIAKKNIHHLNATIRTLMMNINRDAYEPLDSPLDYIKELDKVKQSKELKAKTESDEMNLVTSGDNQWLIDDCETVITSASFEAQKKSSARDQAKYKVIMHLKQELENAELKLENFKHRLLNLFPEFKEKETIKKNNFNELLRDLVNIQKTHISNTEEENASKIKETSETFQNSELNKSNRAPKDASEAQSSELKHVNQPIDCQALMNEINGLNKIEQIKVNLYEKQIQMLEKQNMMYVDAIDNNKTVTKNFKEENSKNKSKLSSFEILCHHFLTKFCELTHSNSTLKSQYENLAMSNSILQTKLKEKYEKLERVQYGKCMASKRVLETNKQHQLNHSSMLSSSETQLPTNRKQDCDHRLKPCQDDSSNKPYSSGLLMKRPRAAEETDISVPSTSGKIDIQVQSSICKGEFPIKRAKGYST